jgi:hypothetical protein
MDENIKCLVASNLTIAFCAQRPVPIMPDLRKTKRQNAPPDPRPMYETEVLDVYRYFLEILDPRRTERES